MKLHSRKHQKKKKSWWPEKYSNKKHFTKCSCKQKLFILLASFIVFLCNRTVLFCNVSAVCILCIWWCLSVVAMRIVCFNVYFFYSCVCLYSCLLWVWSWTWSSFSVFGVFVCVCLSVHIVLRGGGCVVSIFFVRASACFVCVAVAWCRFGCVLIRCMFCCAKSRCQIGECVPHFFSFLRFISAQTTNICCQVGDSASFICWRVVYICMPLPLTWALRTTGALQGTRGKNSYIPLKQLEAFFFFFKCIS